MNDVWIDTTWTSDAGRDASRSSYLATTAVLVNITLTARLATKKEIHPHLETVLSTAAGSIHDLAADLGVSYATLYAWTTGRRKPGNEMLARIAEVADARADRLRDTAEELRALSKGEARPPGPNNSHGRLRKGKR